MLDKEVKIGKECIFALTATWSEINYGIITDVRIQNGKNIYMIYNSDEDKYYEREAGWIRQLGR